MRALLFFVLLACACDREGGSIQPAPQPTVEAAPRRDAKGRALPSESVVKEGVLPPAPEDWAGRLSAVRGRLFELEAAHSDRNEALSKAAWTWAYQENFQPLIAEPAKGRVDQRELVAVEYAFGRLLVALDTPDHEKVGARRAELDALLQALVAKLETTGPPVLVEQ